MLVRLWASCIVVVVHGWFLGVHIQPMTRGYDVLVVVDHLVITERTVPVHGWVLVINIPPIRSILGYHRLAILIFLISGHGRPLLFHTAHGGVPDVVVVVVPAVHHPVARHGALFAEACGAETFLQTGHTLPVNVVHLALVENGNIVKITTFCIIFLFGRRCSHIRSQCRIQVVDLLISQIHFSGPFTSLEGRVSPFENFWIRPCQVLKKEESRFYSFFKIIFLAHVLYQNQNFRRERMDALSPASLLNPSLRLT